MLYVIREGSIRSGILSSQYWLLMLLSQNSRFVTDYERAGEPKFDAAQPTTGFGSNALFSAFELIVGFQERTAIVEDRTDSLAT